VSQHLINELFLGLLKKPNKQAAMLLATNNSDYDSNDPTNLYLAQLYAAQQQAAASLNAKVNI
jgi:hypothetical protein